MTRIAVTIAAVVLTICDVPVRGGEGVPPVRVAGVLPAVRGRDALATKEQGQDALATKDEAKMASPRTPDGVTTNRPNILIILADDLGYGDVQCYNPQRGKIPTPNLDRLAREGMRFTDAHSSSGVCSPSRYALLTGRYHWRTRLQQGIVNVWGAPLIAPDRLTVAGLAQQHGYRTACIGKWHLGRDWPITEQQRPYFTGFGGQAGGGGQVSTTATEAHRAVWRKVFSQSIPGGPTTRGFDEYFGTDVPNWPPYCFIENDRTVGIPSELLSAEKLRTNQASLQGPALPGWQLEPILPMLADRAAAFIRQQSEAKKPFLLYLPLTAPHTPLAVTEQWLGKSGLNLYADFVMETDAMVGRVLEALRESGTAENTIVLFTSDNGCAPYVGAAELESKGHFPSGPLRGYKGDVFEGGHRIPFIVRWPGVVKPGVVCGQLVHQADLIATVADILSTKLPDNAGEDSFSLLPLLKGEDKPVRDHAVSCASSGIPGLRYGPWKLILARDPKTKTEVQLYNLDDDIGETTNLATEKPETVGEMEMLVLMDKLILHGRSTPGAKQKNDVEVRRYPVAEVTKKKAPSKQEKK
jgi:arylsulfatase A